MHRSSTDVTGTVLPLVEGLAMFKTAVVLAGVLLLVSAPLRAWGGEATRGKRPWKGFAVMGNGTLCAVYSDDPRVEAITHGRGLQHLYFNDYTADYVSSTAFEVRVGNRVVAPTGPPQVDRADPYSTRTRIPYPGGAVLEVRCVVHPLGAVLLSGDLKAAPADLLLAGHAGLRVRIVTDQKIALTALERRQDPSSPAGSQHAALARWSNGAVLLAASQGEGMDVDVARGSAFTLMGRSHQAMLVLVPGASEAEALDGLERLRRGVLGDHGQPGVAADIFREATEAWEKWIQQGVTPSIPAGVPNREAYLRAFRCNLYAVKSACLSGHIPADITGQFLTHGMPQLYPRDALMCARVFLESGHLEEARSLIAAWLDPRIPRKTPGEYYARYNARAQAVDAGSGARYDEPEWDANGYMLHLLSGYHRRTGIWLARPEQVFALADFLVAKVDDRGLLYEGGIVEWTGYLPATNMVAAAGLRDAAVMAEAFSDPERSRRYLQVADRLTSSLDFTFDLRRRAYTAVRYHAVKTADNRSIVDRTGPPIRLWDSTVYFGPLWGFPVTPHVQSSDRFYQENTVVMGGGLQYFDAKDQPWLEAYGHDAFFFPTAAAARYHFTCGDRTRARRHVDWMMANLNAYGLCPERIHLDESDCSEASPLSWCCAEFASALLAWPGEEPQGP